ncbi:MAG: Wzz/FepE/Etk N-terminal domain-containing protein [Pseudomonadota bacterium]
MPENNILEPSASTHSELRTTALIDVDEIDLVQIFKIFWFGKKDIALITGIFAILSILFALLQPNIFRPETVLAPAEVRQSSSPLTGQLGAAASLVGISAGEGSGQVTNAIAILRSREFTRKFIADHEILPHLMASEWDDSEGRNVIDPDVYDESMAVWMSDVPSDWAAYKIFSSILSTEYDQTAGLIRIAIEWPDPAQATQWVNWLVEDINRHIKERDLTEARNSVEYLRGQLESTQLVEMQRVFYQLIESQTRVIMLADVRDEYVFQIIDPAVVPEDRVSPDRALICIIGTMLGGLLSLLYVFVNHQVGGFNYSELNQRVRHLIGTSIVKFRSFNAKPK